MYVCVCNALNERTVDRAIGEGARTPAQVHAACGATPRCGKCAVEIAARIARAPERRQGRDG